MALRLGLAFLALAAGVLAQEGEQLCGGAPYWSSDYTCYDDSVLCPVSYGIPTFPCGGACYHREMYRCVAGTSLRLLPRAAGSFGLTVQGTVSYAHSQEVRACGGYLAFGAGARECTSCVPELAPKNCAAYQNKTVLQTDGKMGSDLPGHQYWYLNTTDGALMYTLGGEANGPDEIATAGKGVTIYQDGFFSYNGLPYWLACLRTLPGGTVGTGRAYRIYAPTPDNLAKTGCDQIKLVSYGVQFIDQGAFKYN
ncbi:hypothetical protein QBC47DRAFT_438686 [Echria macrotheca]|uniref:Endo-1,3(4)-beta-glucanase 1 carbohydrate binding domain-containing protein n=1 Tax=Echria macrotheca TaxID=438768 RepID=A0AAJ0B565_9PEZI|nr:hypothetical protein QBC47DRAFT_438686 [Echria macrotheca]